MRGSWKKKLEVNPIKYMGLEEMLLKKNRENNLDEYAWQGTGETVKVG